MFYMRSYLSTRRKEKLWWMCSQSRGKCWLLHVSPAWTQSSGCSSQTGTPQWSRWSGRNATTSGSPVKRHKTKHRVNSKKLQGWGKSFPSSNKIIFGTLKKWQQGFHLTVMAKSMIKHGESLSAYHEITDTSVELTYLSTEVEIAQ